MIYKTVITPKDLLPNVDNPDVRIVDCRFSLSAPEIKLQEYRLLHIPRSVYAHLERDLSGQVKPGVTGRHPLPEIDQLADFLGRIGVDENVQVVAYDDAGGALAAARLWWLLRWLGHNSVAVLDGGWQAWLEASYPVVCGIEFPPPRKFVPRVRPEMMADSSQVTQIQALRPNLLVDARTPDRYRGENETIDPVAGHIPGARNIPYKDNLDQKGRFLPKERLYNLYRNYEIENQNEGPVFYCGSGVTACLNVLAYLHANLGEARLYPGSWSEWITDSSHPIASGQEPGR